jgi:hypothetical protein
MNDRLLNRYAITLFRVKSDFNTSGDTCDDRTFFVKIFELRDAATGKEAGSVKNVRIG